MYLADFSDLDSAFKRIAESRTYSFQDGERPNRPFDSSVLLASTAHKADGANDQCYLLVGLLHNCSLSEDRHVLSFSGVRRFIIPIVVSSEASSARRTDLLGGVMGWGPQPLAYLPEGAAERTLVEALSELRPRKPPRD